MNEEGDGEDALDRKNEVQEEAEEQARRHEAEEEIARQGKEDSSLTGLTRRPVRTRFRKFVPH